MPRHIISDAHEWINDIPTVPIYYLAKPQPREPTWENQRGKKTLLSLTQFIVSSGCGSKSELYSQSVAPIELQSLTKNNSVPCPKSQTMYLDSSSWKVPKSLL